jgi:hypothetical protein
MTSTSSAAGLLAALLALAATPAGASPGNGIRLGGSEGRLHPYLDLEGRWDSNVTYGADDQALSDVIIHVRPGFELAVPGDLVAVELGANLDWAQYLGLEDSATADDLSKLYAQAGLGLTVSPRGTVGLELDDEFRRSASTSSFTFDGAVISNYNALKLKMPVRPGGGALVFSLTGGWTLETFEPYLACAPGSTEVSCDEELLSDLGYNEYGAGGELRWHFLPRTSAVLEGSWFSRVPNDTVASPEVSWVEGRTGVAGLVTPRLGLTLKAGYAGTLSAGGGEDFGTWLATVEAEWRATDAASLTAGWVRDMGVDPGYGLSLYASDRIAAGAKYAVDGRYSLRADASWELRSYDVASGSETADLIRVEPSFEAFFSRWLSLSLGYAYTSRDSSFSDQPGFVYTKHEAWLRLALTY